MHVAIAQLPSGHKDPDDFVRARGGQAYRDEVIARAVHWVEWQVCEPGHADDRTANLGSCSWHSASSM